MSAKIQYIQGTGRNQLQVVSLGDTIGQENPVRFIDAFVNSIDSATAFGTTGKNPRGEGITGFN